MGQSEGRAGGAGGAPGFPAPEWVETLKDGVWLGKVRDFAGDEAAAFSLRESGKVLYLDLKLETPSGRDEFIPPPKVAPFEIGAAPGTPGKIRYFAIQALPKHLALQHWSGRRGTYLGFEPGAPAEPIPLGLDALALLAAGGNSTAAQDYRKALPSATPLECFDAVRALLWARSRKLLKESIQERPPVLGEDPHEEWKARCFAEGIGSLARLTPPEGRGDLAVLSLAARAWAQRATPQAATQALAASIGTEFTGWEFAPRQKMRPGIEARVEPRYGPFQEEIDWWSLCSEIEPAFAKDVLTGLRDTIGETGLWIESVDARRRKVVGHDEPAWDLGEDVNIPEGAGFGSRVSVISRPGRGKGGDKGKHILALKLEAQEPNLLALLILKTARGREVGVLARERAAGRTGLFSDWPQFVDSFQDFSPLEALQVSRDPKFLEELEALLPRTLQEARHRQDTSSIEQPIVVALGWMAVKSYGRARKLLDRTPELIRIHGVPYGSDGTLSSYQESLIVHARWLADRLEKPEAALPPEPAYAGSGIGEWIKALELTYKK
jgi:hypothetical protein